MVAKIIDNTTAYEDLQAKVRDEMRECLRDAANKLECHPEQLKIRVVRNQLTGETGYEVERIEDEGA
jgi:transcriptional regulator CtsR